MEIIYAVLAQPVLVPQIKIGWTDNFERRLSQIRRLNPGQIDVLRTIPGNRAQEQDILRELVVYKNHHEWHHDSEFIRGWLDSFFGSQSEPLC